MTQVARLKGLKTLYLTGTPVGDAGVRQLETLASLETLDVSGSRVSDDGWRKLQEAIPALKAPE
jgi:hypothetical protein